MAALALFLGACSRIAPVDPLGSSPAPALVSACPARFNFEDGSLANWSAPAWPGGFIALQIDRAHAYCGSAAMHVRMELGGTGNKMVVIQTLFDQLQTLSGATRSLHIYFEQAPPAQVRLQAVFVGQDLNWKSPSPSAGSSFSAGWNNMSGVISTPQAAGLLLQFDVTGPVHWTGDAWIDEINW